MPLFALWSFASPWLLLWGATAALPVLLHLWSRRRYLETPWAATQFLLAAIRRHQRRIQIEQWLLLAIRAAILLLLAVALAQPIISGLGGLGGRLQEPSAYTILVVDTSYSMAYATAGATLLSQAQSQAARLVEEAAPGDAFSLVTLADPPEVIVGEPSASHASLRDELQRLRITNGGADLTATLEQVERLLDAARDDSAFPVQRVHIFSDLGMTTWSDQSSANWRSRLSTLSQRADCELSQLGQNDDAENTAVTRIALPSGNVNVGVPVSVEVNLANFTGRQQLRRRIELSLDGQRVGEQFVDLAIGGQATAAFSVTFHVAGDHLLRASISEDQLPLDDQRWLSVPVRDATRVLCIQGRPHAAEYIALALQPDDDDGGVSAEVASEHAILERNLQEYDGVFLCNVARLTAVEAQQLRQYVEQGGGVVFVLGDLVRAESYNEQLGDDSPARLLPVRLNEVVSDGGRTFDPLEYRHALTVAFRGHERAGLLTVPTWRYIRLDQISETASIALAFDNGDPALVTAAVGQGRVVVFATAASPESVDRTTEPPTPWTALAAWPSFPPLIHEMVQFSAGDRVARRNVLVGDVLTWQVPRERREAKGSLTTPGDHQIPVQLTGNEPVWTFGPAGEPGVYRLVLEDPASDPKLFAANLDTRESNLEPAAWDGLAAYFEPVIAAELAAPETVQHDLPLFRLVLGGLLALLVAETWLAGRFGRAA